MSIVSIVSTYDHLSIVSDGLAIHMDGSGNETHRTQNFQKFESLVDNKFLAYTGTVEVIEEVKRENNELIYHSNNNLKYKFESLFNSLKNNSRQNKNSAISIGGLENGQLKFYIGNANGKTFFYQTTQGTLDYAFMGADHTSTTDFNELNNEFKNNLIKSSGNVQEVINHQESIIKKFAEVDWSINDVTNFLLINRI